MAGVGRLDALVGRVRGAQRAPDPQNSAHRLFYNKFFAELAQAQAAYFLSRVGWTLKDFDPPGQPPGEDVDVVLLAPNGDAAVAQVKAPDLPPEERAGIHASAGDDARVFAATCKALAQLPKPARARSLLVTCANRLIELSYNPDPIELVIVGATASLGNGETILRRCDRGGFLAAPEIWAHCGAVMLLDFMRWSAGPMYSCTVFVNPTAAATAACRPEWFPGASVLVFEDNQLRWVGGEAPEDTTIPDGTRLRDDDAWR